VYQPGSRDKGLPRSRRARRATARAARRRRPRPTNPASTGTSTIRLRPRGQVTTLHVRALVLPPPGRVAGGETSAAARRSTGITPASTRMPSSVAILARPCSGCGGGGAARCSVLDQDLARHAVKVPAGGADPLQRQRAIRRSGDRAPPTSAPANLTLFAYRRYMFH
jgi:hypothetical protein